MTFSAELLKQCWILAGPTACGKTDLSLHLAERINAEIIALDSMTVYRGMDIGTAKPKAQDQARIRHHLIDIINPDDDYSLADYLSAAEDVCQDMIRRGKTPLFVGGTGLYLRGLLRGVFEGPPANWDFRRDLDRQIQLHGPDWLVQRLHEVDPQSAMRLHPNDQRRMIRALEVFQTTGKPLSELQQQGPREVHERPAEVFWISPPRDWLYRRIDKRVIQMFQEGLLDEVANLIRRPNPISHSARQALGYKEVIDYFETHGSLKPHSGLHDEILPTQQDFEQLVTLIQTRTRQFAKRQHTWFRNLQETRAIEISGNESTAELVEMIIRRNSTSATPQPN